MSDILLEIDEALRNQRIKALWDRYGQWFVGFAVATIIATAVGAFWHSHMTKTLAADTAELLTLLQNEAEDADTSAKLAELSPKTHAPLNAVADLYHAQKLEQSGDLKATQAMYGTIMKNTKATGIVRDLARVHYVRLGVVSGDEPKTLLPIIEPLTKSRSEFKGTALELKGMLLLKQDNTKAANEIFIALSKDETVPTSLRNRAKTFIVYDEAKNAK